MKSALVANPTRAALSIRSLLYKRNDVLELEHIFRFQLKRHTTCQDQQYDWDEFNAN